VNFIPLTTKVFFLSFFISKSWQFFFLKEQNKFEFTLKKNTNFQKKSIYFVLKNQIFRRKKKHAHILLIFKKNYGLSFTTPKSCTIPHLLNLVGK